MPRSKVASSDSRFDGGVSHQRISGMNGADSISRTSQRRISRGTAAPALHPPPPTTLMSLAAPDPRAMLHMNPPNSRATFLCTCTKISSIISYTTFFSR
ncbi:hypothetical protein PS1_044201 [Malus domestica]